MADAVNVSDLEHLWDPSAKPLFTNKPPEWIATYLPRRCQSVSDQADSDCRGLALTVRELQRDQFWQKLFPDWEACCQALFKRPSAWVEQVVEGVKVLHGKGHDGAITTNQALAAQASQTQPLAPARRPTTAEAEGKLAIGQVRPAEQLSSNSQERILRRLARDAPEILERVKAGEFKSAREAAIKAGIIKDIPTIRLVSDHTKIAASIRKHLSSEQIHALCEALLSITN